MLVSFFLLFLSRSTVVLNFNNQLKAIRFITFLILFLCYIIIINKKNNKKIIMMISFMSYNTLLKVYQPIETIKLPNSK